ncbi:MAG: nucleotidyltransferase substrate binding protein [Chloroflexi bacterium]|nr:nucleotidyltransferase substrate binding protein [Chloroflexota bacterium]
MERIKERAQVARKALSTLQELTNKPELSLIERDATIQRFEYTFEATWKTAQLYLAEVEGVSVNSPKGVVRASWQAGLFDEATSKLALQMCDARNMTVHTYNEKIAMTIYHQIEDYVGVFEIWLNAIEKKLAS